MATVADTTLTPSRSKRPTLIRHTVVIIISAALVYAFATVHGDWSPMHRWNRAFGDAAIVLLAMTMSIGAMSRLVRPTAKWLPWRRELGIYAVLLATAHTGIILDGWVEWDFFRLFGFEFHPVDLNYVMLQHGFGLSNTIGILALGIGFLLMLTSSDRAVRYLGATSWKTVQMSALVFWALVVVHTAYFLYAHFTSFHRATPSANRLQLPFAFLVLAIVALRAAAFLATIRGRARRELV
ncbi:ferric reductase-like transmembrane domain-containing protein [Natronohydrobacter thiooxidans]|uniref:ferric reductase-like transmembrane domain-containing protein n=1 Tax=Natronohydrobacter thiooxidans TaxID=87172 RepID=UPI0008FF16D8|nr:ferric reductase-like transmembrane domain-containing protein [Natronohydrobacter thiooxidans]